MSDITKHALEASLKHLLLKKPLNKITISDIAEDCGISRMTFYYHFKDIYDLVEWICTEEASKALAGNKTYNTWQEGLVNLFNVVLENKPIVLNVYHSISREQLERYLYEVTYELLIQVIEEQSTNMSVRQDDKERIAHFYKYAFVGVMLEWVRHDMRDNPQKMVENINLIMHENILNALERYRNDKN